MSKRVTAGLTVVKGEGTALTAVQRELVDVFIQYLRRLPLPDEEGMVKTESYSTPETVWKNSIYSALNQLLSSHFGTIYPEWTVKRGAMNRQVNDLPDGKGEDFSRLMYNAAAPEHGRTIRRRKLLRLATDKRYVVKITERYEQDRKELGLSPDYNLAALRKPTPIEERTCATWVTPGS